MVVLSNGSAGRAVARSVLADVVPAWFGVNVATLRLDPSPDLPEQLGRTPVPTAGRIAEST